MYDPTRCRTADTPPQETATLEAKAYELEQRTALAAEAKTVLDSWVRYESQVKQRQQRELAQSIIAKVQKELENPKVLQQILQQSVQDVESGFLLSFARLNMLLTSFQESSRPRLNKQLLQQGGEARFPLYQCQYTPLCNSPNTTSLRLGLTTLIPQFSFLPQWAILRMFGKTYWLLLLRAESSMHLSATLISPDTSSWFSVVLETTRVNSSLKRLRWIFH